MSATATPEMKQLAVVFERVPVKLADKIDAHRLATVTGAVPGDTIDFATIDLDLVDVALGLKRLPGTAGGQAR